MTHLFKHLLPEQPSHFIDGQWVSASESDEVLNPSTGKVITRVATGDKTTIDQAVRQAAIAQQCWAKSLSRSARPSLRPGLNRLKNMLRHWLICW